MFREVRASKGIAVQVVEDDQLVVLHQPPRERGPDEPRTARQQDLLAAQSHARESSDGPFRHNRGRASATALAARQALGHLRPGRRRLAPDRRPPAAGRHALPGPQRARCRRHARRALDRARDRLPRRDLDGVLPLLLRREGRRRPRDGGAHVFLVHDGRGDDRPRARLHLRRADLGAALLDARSREPRPRRVRPRLGADELRAADLALPGRGALGRVRHRDGRERPDHRRLDDPAGRGLAQGSDRRPDRQLHRDAGRVPRAARLPALPARARVRPRALPADAAVRPAARPVRARALGGRPGRPVPPAEAERAQRRSASTRSACESRARS